MTLIHILLKDGLKVEKLIKIMKRLHFELVGEISEEGKEKLRRMMEKKEERLKQIKKDFDEGKLKIPGVK